MLGLTKNLLSMAQITSTSNTIITFTCTQCIIRTKFPESSKHLKLCLNKAGSLFSLGIGVTPSNFNYSATTLSQPEIESLKWHYCLGHSSIRSLTLMHSHNLVHGLPPPISNPPCLYVKVSFWENNPKDLIQPTLLPTLLYHLL